MQPYKRSQRLNILLREEIADIIVKRIKDPRFGFVTVTDVNLSDDLKIAHVYISALKTEERAVAIEILNAAKGVIRSEVAKRVRTKYVPQLEFHIDESIEQGFRTDKLLKEIKEKGPAREEDE
jgi:ribosome-binding factor A